MQDAEAVIYIRETRLTHIKISPRASCRKAVVGQLDTRPLLFTQVGQAASMLE